jgi:DDE superfamily endonuclease
VARLLPGRCHDALNRLLRTMPLSTRTLMGLLIAWVRRSGGPGYLCLDDVVVEKAFAKKLPWAGWTYSFAKKRKVYGLHIVVLLWCADNGCWRIPVAFRRWRPRRACAPERYQTKLQLAARMLTELVAARLPIAYLVMDTHYTAGWFTRLVGRLGLTWVGPCTPVRSSSGAAAGSLLPSSPTSCALAGGRGLACAPPRSLSMRPATGCSGWS